MTNHVCLIFFFLRGVYTKHWGKSVHKEMYNLQGIHFLCKFHVVATELIVNCDGRNDTRGSNCFYTNILHTHFL